MTTDSKQERFAQLYSLYSGSMYRIAYGILRDEGLAQDAVQQTFLKLYSDMDRVGEPRSGKTRSFMVVLVRNTAIDSYRKRRREQVLYLDDLDKPPICTGPLPEERAIDSQSREEVERVLIALGDKYATILLLRYCYGYRNKEIAEHLDMTEASVASRIFQAKRLLAKSDWAREAQSA